MSIREILGLKSQGNETSHQDILVSRFGEMCGERRRGRISSSLFEEFADDRTWRTRDYAIAVYRLEQFGDETRAAWAELERNALLQELEEGEHDFVYMIQREEDTLRRRMEKARESETDTGGILRAGDEVVRHERPDWFWELAIATNAAVKGLLGSMNQSGHICARVTEVEGLLDVQSGQDSLVGQIVDRLNDVVSDGDVVVLAEKIFAAAQGRIGPRSVLLSPDPKTVPTEELPELAGRWEEWLGFEVKPIHLLLADEYEDDKATLGADDHNGVCANVAKSIEATLSRCVDVVISDTDTGLDIRHPLIGTLTIGASPIGATAGLTLYEAMRCACAAEFVRGHNRLIPIVVCRPAARRSRREGMGEHRGYAGALNAMKEPGIAHA